MIGPVVPMPAPRVVLDALDSVKVTDVRRRAERLPARRSSSASKSPLQHDLPVAAGSSASITPPLRVLLIVTLNGTPQPLIDGVMTNVEVAGRQPGQRPAR